MRRLPVATPLPQALAVVLVLAVVACRRGTGPEAPLDPIPIDVSGQVAVLPESERVLGSAPAVAGLRVRLQDPLRATLADPDATRVELTAGQDGAFATTELDARKVSVALTAVVFAEGSSAFVPFSTALFDTAHEGEPLRASLSDTRAFALTAAFATTLSTFVTEPNLRAATSDLWGDIVSAGFVFGQVLDLQGQPVTGARVVTLGVDGQPTHREARIYYPDDGYTPVGGAPATVTGPRGLFVYLHTGFADEVFLLGVEGQPNTPPSYALGRTGSGSWVTLGPDN